MGKFDKRNETTAAKSVTEQLLGSMATAAPAKTAKPARLGRPKSSRETKSAHMQLLVRPTTKAAAFEAAEAAGVSLNEWANRAIEAQLEKEGRLQ